MNLAWETFLMQRSCSTTELHSISKLKLNQNNTSKSCSSSLETSKLLAIVQAFQNIHFIFCDGKAIQCTSAYFCAMWLKNLAPGCCFHCCSPYKVMCPDFLGKRHPGVRLCYHMSWKLVAVHMDKKTSPPLYCVQNKYATGLDLTHGPEYGGLALHSDQNRDALSKKMMEFADQGLPKDRSRSSPRLPDVACQMLPPT